MSQCQRMTSSQNDAIFLCSPIRLGNLLHFRRRLHADKKPEKNYVEQISEKWQKGEKDDGQNDEQKFQNPSSVDHRSETRIICKPPEVFIIKNLSSSVPT